MFSRKKYALKKSNLCTILFILMPILGQYRIISFSPNLAFGIFVVFYILISNNFQINISNKIIIYICYVICLTAIMSKKVSYGNVNTLVNRMIGFVIIVFAFYICLPKVLNFRLGLKFYTVVVIVSSIFVIVQFALFYISGIAITFLIPNVKYGEAVDAVTNIIIEHQILNGRFSSFFLEPAHQAEFSLPCLALNLFPINHYDKKKSYIIPVIISCGICMTTSMLGIGGILLIWCYYFLSIVKVNMKKKDIILLLVLVVCGIGVFSRPIIIEQFAKKIASFRHLENTDTSLYLRVMVGWSCFRDMSIVTKIFGCGYGNITQFIIDTGTGLDYYKYSQGLIGYMSGLSKIFCEIGIIGSSLYCMIWWEKIKYCMNKYLKDNYIKIMIICFLWIMLTSSSFDNNASLLPMIFLFSACNLDDKYLIKVNMEEH